MIVSEMPHTEAPDDETVWVHVSLRRAPIALLLHLIGEHLWLASRHHRLLPPSDGLMHTSPRGVSLLVPADAMAALLLVFRPLTGRAVLLRHARMCEGVLP